MQRQEEVNPLLNGKKPEKNDLQSSKCQCPSRLFPAAQGVTLGSGVVLTLATLAFFARYLASFLTRTCHFPNIYEQWVCLEKQKNEMRLKEEGRPYDLAMTIWLGVPMLLCFFACLAITRAKNTCHNKKNDEEDQRARP